ncbi:MAG: alanine--tRNA ligase-related protein, partial [Candidatus Woesearchaeota archaeon]
LMWLNEGMGLPSEELTIHEDVWAGGGNFGPCLEFFSRGLEISNQVYMQYEHTTSGIKELKIKVLDMGQGQERAAWFTQGLANSYEASFPEVIKKLRKITGIGYDEKLMSQFAQYSPYLNVNEAKDINAAWASVAERLGIDLKELTSIVQPIAGLYAVAEHTRALLVTLADGALPSNVGGMYNLRVVLRKAVDLIEKYGWRLSLCDIAEWHAEELKPQYPELLDFIENVKKILEVEQLKYRSTKERALRIAQQIAGRELSAEELIALYDSEGINPELVAAEAKKIGKEVVIPKDFYALVAARHEQKVPQETATEREERIEFGELPATKALYFGDWRLTECRAKVLGIVDNAVVLDQTVFYPTSGGQLADKGTIDNSAVVDVFKQGNLIVHRLAEKPLFKVGDVVDCKVDFERRMQLTQHHTSTHIVNAAARKVLGAHVNQASAKKDIDKAYIDITHYQPISDEELKEIEKEANRIVQQAIPVKKAFYPRHEAEKKFGMGIYQGGVAPGKELRIVEISGVDVEACGGTHLNSTSEATRIKLLKSTKVKDGVVRIFYVAGKAAEKVEKEEEGLLKELSLLLGVSAVQIPARAKEIFEKWKKARKLVGKGQKRSRAELEEFELVSEERFEGSPGEIVKKTAEIINTQPEHLVKTLKRFLSELEEFKRRLSEGQ